MAHVVENWHRSRANFRRQPIHLRSSKERPRHGGRTGAVLFPGCLLLAVGIRRFVQTYADRLVPKAGFVPIAGAENCNISSLLYFRWNRCLIPE